MGRPHPPAQSAFSQLTVEDRQQLNFGSATVITTRALDVIFALVLLVALAPLFLLIALLVRIDSHGPSVFRQSRLGRDQQPFTMWKFRSMCWGADPECHRQYVRSLIVDGAKPPRDTAELFKLVGDERITRVGNFLRRWSLDELPQIWNVLKGDMSLVGPRPVIPYEVAAYRPWYFDRFKVKPGMTGLWQVQGRNTCSYEEMVELDIKYVEEKTISGDLRIMLKTVRVVLSHEGVA